MFETMPNMSKSVREAIPLLDVQMVESKINTWKKGEITQATQVILSGGWNMFYDKNAFVVWFFNTKWYAEGEMYIKDEKGEVKAVPYFSNAFRENW
jgi:hypothetical protein